jgi:hypothetical protein
MEMLDIAVGKAAGILVAVVGIELVHLEAAAAAFIIVSRCDCLSPGSYRCGS